MAVIFRLAGRRFYQNVRRLLKFCRLQGQASQTPDDVVYFESVVTLDAPEREVENLQFDDETVISARHRMAVHHFGLLGTHGALPLAYTEWLIDRRYRYGDESAKAFIDIFNHRLLSLRFQAWQKFRLYAHAELNFTLRLPGIINAVTGQCPQAMLPAADKGGLLAPSVRSLVNLQHLLQREFSLPVSVAPFQGRWREVQNEYQASLGKCGLGLAPVLGRVYWDIQSHFLIQLGPLTAAHSEEFMPGGNEYLRLFQRIRLFTGDLLTFSLALLVSPERTGIALNGESRLGWTGFLGNAQQQDVSRLYVEPSVTVT
ncbi:type VI secretion system baseplate subunit TssG [Serratia fonticola]|uniref:type VI secretion system baseplate subunit TssG n=1 Tax=Serratia fonticola TaxID=47917 RepID=UPI000401C3ED|nr:type VI secretion system baseplate subunit TssG [Serratia fonticola]